MAGPYDELLALSRGRAPECAVTRALEAMKPEDAQAIRKGMDDPTITIPAIARFMAQRGHVMSTPTVRRHQRRDCRCPR